MRLVPLFSGSSGNSYFIESENCRLLVDAGVTAKRITDALARLDVSPDTLSGILVTHEHIDHIRGIDVLCRKYGIPVYANAGTWNAMQERIGEQRLANMRVIETDRGFYIKDMEIYPFSTPHDAAESVGYRVRGGDGGVVSVATDMGHMREEVLAVLEKSDILVLESNHDVDMLKAGPYPYPLKRRILSDTGHLSNVAAGHAIARLYVSGVRNVILAHLSKDNNMPSLALETVNCELDAEGVPAEGIRLTVAMRDEPTGIFNVE